MASSEESFLARRIDATAAPLAVVDLLALSAVLTYGVINHNGVDYLTTATGGWLLTLVPFLLGWAVASPLVGAYSAGAAESAKAAVPLALRSWLLADAIALGIRATPFVRGGVQLTFVLVSLGVGLVGLALWRTLFFKLR